jgi:hypothetical protein
MTDNSTAERAPSAARVSANIRAELVRAGQTAADAQWRLDIGESAWRTRMSKPERWTIGELLTLAKWLRCDVTDLIRDTR